MGMGGGQICTLTRSKTMHTRSYKHNRSCTCTFEYCRSIPKLASKTLFRKGVSPSSVHVTFTHQGDFEQHTHQLFLCGLAIAYSMGNGFHHFWRRFIYNNSNIPSPNSCVYPPQKCFFLLHLLQSDYQTQSLLPPHLSTASIFNPTFSVAAPLFAKGSHLDTPKCFFFFILWNTCNILGDLAKNSSNLYFLSSWTRTFWNQT